MTLSEYNSIVETDYILSSRQNREIIDKALTELEAGDTVNFELPTK